MVNEYSEEELSNLIYEYSEERFARKIAFNICKKKRRERNRNYKKN